MVLVDSYQSEIAPNIETVIHNYFKHKKNNPEEGLSLLGEWFLLEKKDIESFQSTCQKIEGNLKSISENTMFY
jgi:hypothetical protein